MVCTCGQPWNSILPPPPCPFHNGGQSITYTFRPFNCKGRHCRHDYYCWGSVTFNG